MAEGIGSRPSNGSASGKGRNRHAHRYRGRHRAARPRSSPCRRRRPLARRTHIGQPFAVQEIADVLASLPADVRRRITVLVKNPVNPDLELWIGALSASTELAYAAASVPFTEVSAPTESLPLPQPAQVGAYQSSSTAASVPPTNMRPQPHRRRTRTHSTTLAAGLDMNYDGLIIETHCRPDEALSDKAQQITPTPSPSSPAPSKCRSRGQGTTTESLTMLRQIRPHRLRTPRTPRKANGVARDIRPIQKRALHARRPARSLQQPHGAARRTGRQTRMSREFVATVLAAIHEESVRQQLEICTGSTLDPSES